MPPPTSRRLTRGSSAPMTSSLSETFEPPRTTVYGFSGLTVRRSSTSSSCSISKPAALGSSSANSYTLACLRCTTPKPSETNASPKAAIFFANALRSVSSLLVSSALKRRFSSSTMSPSPSSLTAFLRPTAPTVSCANATGLPSSSDSRFATGARLYLASGEPSGRPRCEITTSFAPAPESAPSVPSDARIRPSSVI